MTSMAEKPDQHSQMSNPVLLGVITDIQYADKNDIYNKYFRRNREYRKALDKTKLAIEAFNTLPLKAVVHLGDIVDGNVTTDETVTDFDRTVTTLLRLHAPVLHVLGNHCLNVPQRYLLHHLNLKSPYYIKDLSSSWRLVVLNTVEVSVLRPPESPYFAQALKYLREHRDEPNAKMWNGGIGMEQLKWLEQVLASTEEQQRFIVVCGHLPLLENAAKPGDVLWESERVVQLLERYRTIVKAYFCGHCHRGGYAEKNGIHHVTFEALVDSDDPVGAFAIVELSNDQILIKGKGSVTSRCLKIDVHGVSC